MRAEKDHPRSRGVYALDVRAGRAPYGSSPLARGLREPGRLLPQRRGIIPARAGFTSSHGGLLLGAWDHPRSRGVYGWGRYPSPPEGGSSPLARGLLRWRPEAQNERGIIPARAGFTAHRFLLSVDTSDHPRSRGVYFRALLDAILALGSSPLARGLRRHSAGDDGRGRIIPARAGFTAGRHPGRRRTGDHPRSRGVYADQYPEADGEDGSSPLARGLQFGNRYGRGRCRIIPARAGFTLGDPWNPNDA
mgnify:CR=1 FL=1